jgi:NhaA family Na+:H+ antiporter
LTPPLHPNDHVLGGSDQSEITLVEFGSYACPHCRLANEQIASIRDELGGRLRYVFRHRPISNSPLALQAAELVERAKTDEEFWEAHIELMTRSARLSEDDLSVVAQKLRLNEEFADEASRSQAIAKRRVADDIASAAASGVRFTPAFFINGRRYDGPWDRVSMLDAMAGRLGTRVRAAALDFVSWGPSAGILLLIAALAALIISNTGFGPRFLAFWQQSLGIAIDDSGFHLPLIRWINDGLLTVFFLVVGLEIKREFTVGHLANRRAAALPVVAAIGGMAVPILFYLLIAPGGELAEGWGITMATDTAFAIAILVLLGDRVPVELRVFLTAAAIIDDVAAVLVITFFYSEDINLAYLVAAGLITVALAILNRSSVYQLAPYLVLGVVLWFCIFSAGIHATLAGIVLALFVPTRPPPNLNALMNQATAIIAAEARHNAEVLRHGPSEPAMRSLEEIHNRIESPADRLLRRAGARSSYLVLPIFALANAGVVISSDVFEGHGALMAAIIVGLMIGKPLGFLAFAALATRAGIATKPAAYSWRQLAGAGAMAGIGFTMSLFIAGEAFEVASDFAAAKIAIFIASILSAVVGVAILWNSQQRLPGEDGADRDHTLVAP